MPQRGASAGLTQRFKEGGWRSGGDRRQVVPGTMPQEERPFKKLTIAAIWMDLFQQELAHQCAESHLGQALESVPEAILDMADAGFEAQSSSDDPMDTGSDSDSDDE